MRTHKDLEVWKSGIAFVTEIYKLTSQFPREEQFGLTNQLRRAVVLVPSNIAEGAARNSDKEFLRFLYMAMGSIQEVDTQLLISFNLNFINETQYKHSNFFVEQIAKMISGLIKSVKNKINI